MWAPQPSVSRCLASWFQFCPFCFFPQPDISQQHLAGGEMAWAVTTLLLRRWWMRFCRFKSIGWSYFFVLITSSKGECGLSVVQAQKTATWMPPNDTFAFAQTTVTRSGLKSIQTLQLRWLSDGQTASFRSRQLDNHNTFCLWRWVQHYERLLGKKCLTPLYISRSSRSPMNTQTLLDDTLLWRVCNKCSSVWDQTLQETHFSCFYLWSCSSCDFTGSSKTKGESLKVDRQINQELICVIYELSVEILFKPSGEVRGHQELTGSVFNIKSLGFWLPGSFPAFSSEGPVLIIKIRTWHDSACY